jgi:hypothetical protein
VLSSAYQIARTNKGAAGVDGVTFDDIESRTGASDRALCGRLCGLGAGIRAAGICDYIESQIESWLGLELNRDKTKVFNLRRTGDSLDFLGLTFRYDQDLKGRRFRYLNVTPPCQGIAGAAGGASRDDQCSAKPCT